MLRAVCTKILGKNLWKMSSLAETMKQLRSLNGLVEKLRAETRSFLEAKDREFVNVQNQIQMICSGLTEQSAVPIGNGQGESCSEFELVILWSNIEAMLNLLFTFDLCLFPSCRLSFCFVRLTYLYNLFSF